MVEQVILRVFAVSKEPAIKLPTVFIKIELQKPLINLLMYSFNAATALTCYDMYPWEYVNNDLMLSTVCFLMGFMFFQQFLQPEKTFASIRYSLGICINVLRDEWLDSLILLIRNGWKSRACLTPEGKRR